MKRKTAIFFILLANIILLGHAVIPQHHNEKQICSEDSHQQINGFAHKHSSASNDHQHDCNNNSDNCIIQPILAFRSKNVRPDSDLVSWLNNSSPNNTFHLSFITTYIEVLSPQIEINTSALDIKATYINFVTSSLGLRAPPIV